MTFVDIRDRYGITQLVFDDSKNAQLAENAANLGREYVINIVGPHQVEVAVLEFDGALVRNNFV